MPAPPDDPVPDLLAEATQRLVRAVDALPDDGWREPSGLPGWSRAHVVAHLALNAEGLAGALTGVARAEPAPMYRSQEARDADIRELAAADVTELRHRLLASTTELTAALGALREGQAATRIERTPGGRTFAAASVPGMRLREVEVHHVDLGVGRTHRDWTPAFAVLLVEAMRDRDAAPRPFRAHATDLDRTWSFGEGGTAVSGTVADLAWWLTGRGTGDGLTSDGGDLPRMGAW